ncbi:hypothetical protein LTR08_006565 [Meristemomyces frigidus]|nr:hypothetical protein LTR08_006565 [Meristemomyces frigidus]
MATTTLQEVSTPCDKAMASVTPSHDVFNFFGLAREIRDWIYDESLLPSEAHKCRTELEVGGYLLVTAHQAPATNLALVSRQFKTEYLSRSAIAMSLSVEDHMKAAAYDIKFVLPPRIACSTSIHIDLSYLCMGEDRLHAE